MSRASGSIASLIVHETRGRFAALQPYVELLQEESIGALNEQQRDCVAAIARNLDRLFGGVVGLLELLRGDLDGLSLRPRKASVDEALSAATALLQARGLQALTVGPKEGFPPVMADPVRTGSIVAALCLRAAAASGGGATLRVVACPVQPDRVCVLIALPDCPLQCGISGDLVGERPEDAALALIAWLMRRQGGRLWMAAEGRGSCLALAVAAFATAEEPR